MLQTNLHSLTTQKQSILKKNPKVIPTKTTIYLYANTLSLFLKSSIGVQRNMLCPRLRGGTALTFQLGPFSRTCRGLSSLLRLNLILYCLLVAEEHAIVRTLEEGQDFWRDFINYSGWNLRRNSRRHSRRNSENNLRIHSLGISSRNSKGNSRRNSEIGFQKEFRSSIKSCYSVEKVLFIPIDLER